ncbi:MAG: FecR family protein [Prolixibacteraceae bacterium]|nr:FecR family protein [Prolixibacteraceae bacterium]
MDKGKVIEKISKGEKLTDSKELLNYVEKSEENKKDYIRYKNLWALLQRGKEMDTKHIDEGLRNVKSKIRKSNKSFLFNKVLKYAAVIVFAIIGGYLIHPLTLNEKIAMNEISVPRGNRTLITLPDGSKVWLTNGSKLIYPDNFKGKTRDVQLLGEAFFTVAHNAKKPFIVKLGEHRVKVLGTEFSVVAYPQDNTIQVDLVSGKVQLDVSDGKGNKNYKPAVLQPSHSLVLDKTSGKLSRSKIPDSFFKYWQEGMYQFKNESFGSLAKKIDRIFGVELIFENEKIKNRTFTGTFSIDDNIYTMMEVFRHASGEPFNFHVERNKIYIKSVK